MGTRQQQIKYPSEYKQDEKNLGQYVKYLKVTYQQNRLTKEEIELCESIPGWEWNTKFVSRDKFISKTEFIKWSKRIGIKSALSYRKWCKENTKPKNIPSDPQRIYKNFSWTDVTGNAKDKKFIPMTSFIKWCKKKGIKTRTAWREWYRKNKRPDNIPSKPDVVYKDFSWKMI
jgi:hypothetical protein